MTSKTVTTDAQGTPIRIGDVANVSIGPNIRRGVADLDGKGEVVLVAVDGPELEAADIVAGAATGPLARHVLSLRLAHLGSL
jgi:Cu/Ag efflux pump CusA